MVPPRWLRRVRVLLGAAVLATVAAAALGQGLRMTASSETVPYDGTFTFTRLRYSSGLRNFGGGAWWAHDYPAGDRNLSAVTDYITNMRIRLDGTNVLEFGDPRIYENPVLYISEPGYWSIRDTEVPHLRNYLLKGGFIILDDFDGAEQWSNMTAQMARALPDHHFMPIGPEHPIFHSFFQVQGIYVPFAGIGATPNYQAMFENNDPRRRMMAIANHNNDLGEYWEWSAEGLYDPAPSNNAYRLGVNYLIYAMTH